MALLEAPAVDNRQPNAIHLIQTMPKRPNRTFEHRGVSHVKVQVVILDQSVGLIGLLHTGGGLVNLGPAGEAVFEVSGGFAMANEHKFVHGLCLIGPPDSGCRSFLDLKSQAMFHACLRFALKSVAPEPTTSVQTWALGAHLCGPVSFFSCSLRRHS